MDRLLREGNPPAGQLASPKPQYKDVQTNNWEELKGEGGASYVKDKDALAKLEQVRQLLAGVATEAKLEQARVLLNTISNKDFATQATLEVVQSELALIKSELDNIKQNQTSGDQKVQLSGNDVVIGLLADRPPASEMRGRGYYAWDETDGHKLKYSDGTNWVVNQ